MDKNSVISFLKAQGELKRTGAGLESRISLIERLQRINFESAKNFRLSNDLTRSRTKIRLEDLESRIKKLEEKDLQRLVELNHTASLHSIMLQQTNSILELKAEISEVAYNINNDDRIQTLFNEWQEKLYGMCETLEEVGKSLEKMQIVPLNQEVQFLQREITEDNIRKEQEVVRIELIEEQIENIWNRCENYLPEEEI
jgi:hypothetical protein